MNGVGSYATACFSKKFVGHTDDGEHSYIITIKDSVIALTEARVNGKDSVIAVYIKKEGTYKNIMTNQETQIKDWKNQ